MKRLLKKPGSLPKAFVTFIALITLLSVIGGYQLSRLIYQLHDASVQRAEQLLVIGKNLDDAADQFRTQIQEWKNMLLRVNNPALYGRHMKAFLDSSVDVQVALLRTRIAMKDSGLDVGVIDHLMGEHKSLVANYVLAQAKLDPKQVESSHAADKQVIGADRRLQQHFAEVRAGVDELADRQLNGVQPEQARRYWLTGLLGASSLLVMALIGFLFASWFQAHDSRAMRRLAAG